MSIIEEEVIVQNILKLGAQGLSPTVSLVKDMADSICKIRGGPPVGVNWANTFIKRTPRLQVKLGRTYESQRRLCECPKVIGAWFELVKNTINKYGILPQDIYNFDETGFQMGQISASKVVTDARKAGRPKQVKPTNTQWVTLIQGACADGSTFLHSLSSKGRSSTTHGFTKACLQHGPLQSAQMAGLQTRLASSGSSILKSIQGRRQLEAKGSLFLTNMEAIQHLSSGRFVKTMASFSFGCLHTLHICFNQWMLAALVL